MGMTAQERQTSLHFVIHASASKEVDFFHVDMMEQVQDVQITILLLTFIAEFKNLCLSPVAVIPHVGRRLRLIL